MLRAGHILQLIVIALLGLAVIAVHSADMRIGQGTMFDLKSILQSRHLLHAVVAVIVMLLASRINLRHAMRVRWYFNPVLWLLVASLGLVVVAMVPGIGLEINGARRWLRIGAGGFETNFQPSEMTKWAMVLVIAWWCASRHEQMPRFFKGVLPALMLTGAACALIVLEDLGTSALIAVVAGVLLIAGGARLWQLLMLLPPAMALVVAAVIHKPHRMERLQTFLHPWEDIRGSGYQASQSLIAFGEGGLLGKGLGNGIQKFGYLPTDTSDFLFAVICEETGIAGAAMVIGLYLAMLWTGLSIVKDCKDKFARLVALGIVTTLGIQAVINIAVVTGSAPTKGIALPLLSAGGTGWIVTAFAIGLAASLDAANHMETEGQLDLAPLPA
jgi:cell division protein FtsW